MKILKWTYYVGGTAVFLWWLGTLLDPAPGPLAFLNALPPLPDWLVIGLIVLEAGIFGHQIRRRRAARRPAEAAGRTSPP